MEKIDFWSWKNCKNKKEIKALNNFIDKNYDSFESENKKADKTIKTSTIKIINYGKLKKVLNPIVQSCRRVANLHFGYDITYPYDVEGCNLNIYKSSNLGEYNWHVDESRTPYIDIKLTVLINLSVKKYEGGNFFIFKNGERQITELNNPGDVLMFKSYLAHKVTPVTKGERRTLTIFLMGPVFR